MKKLLFLIFSFVLIALFSASYANADCSQVYGGGTSCPPSFSFTIQKFVQTPGKSGGNFVNNLSINDPKFSPGQSVNFEIVVQNTSSQTIPTLTIVDTFPQFVTFVTGSGNFDSNNNTLTFTVNNLGAGASQTFNIGAKIADASVMPSDQGVICVINQANATDSNGMVNSTSSQLCVQKNVVGTSTFTVASSPVITTTPPTGPEMLPIALLFPTGLSGLLLRKKSIKK